MQTIDRHAPRRRRSLRTPASLFVAATVLVAAVAPASAEVIRQDSLLTRIDAPVSAFHHHFWRGVPGQNRPQAAESRRISGDDMMAIAADPRPRARAAGNCADRYRSYDPVSGTYIGNGGRVRACP